jgi:hypothetical protein
MAPGNAFFDAGSVPLEPERLCADEKSVCFGPGSSSLAAGSACVAPGPGSLGAGTSYVTSGPGLMAPEWASIAFETPLVAYGPQRTMSLMSDASAKCQRKT